MEVFRIEVRPKFGNTDPRGDAALEQARTAGVTPLPTAVDTTAVYLIEGDLGSQELQRIAEVLLCDPVTEESHVGASQPHGDAMIEIHPLPGVMDPDALAVELAIQRLLGLEVCVQTGQRYDFHGMNVTAAEELARRCIANTVVHGIHTEPYHPTSFAHAHEHDLTVPNIPITELSDEALESMSRDAHLFLDLEEMKEKIGRASCRERV